METRRIEQTVFFETTPHEVYELLMDESKFAQLTGSTASIDRKVEGAINLFDGAIEGQNKILEQDSRIVQQWRIKTWPPLLYSSVAFSLSAVEGGTQLELVQRGVPAEEFNHVFHGWPKMYWESMKKIIEMKNHLK